MTVKKRPATAGAKYIPLEPIPPIPLEQFEPDEAKREAAWQRFKAMLENPPQPGPGACAPGDYGTRDEWYDDRTP